MASEDIAFRKNGGEFIEDLEPGAAYYLAPDGSFCKRKIVESRVEYCFFEWNYLADCDSIMNGISVRRLRELLGEKLVEEFLPPDVDLVTFLPRCPEVAARSYAESSGIPFVPTLYKMRGERAFQGSTQADRKVSIDQNLYTLPFIEKMPAKEYLKGKIIVSIDDSMVRGNNSRKEKELYSEAGAVKIYHVNYTPPIGILGEDGIPRGCKFGVDMPPNDDFIARGRTVQEISKEMGMTVVYLSLEAMLKAYKELGLPQENLCTYCIGGRHPFEK